MEDDISLEKISVDEKKIPPGIGETSIKLESSVFENKRYEVNSLVVSNLNYDVVSTEGKCCKKKQHEKRILHNINLNIKTGSLTAILGPSGAGKVLISWRKKYFN